MSNIEFVIYIIILKRKCILTTLISFNLTLHIIWKRNRDEQGQAA